MLDIGVSLLTGRIWQGRLSKNKQSFVGPKRDITSEVLRAITEKAEYHGGSFLIEAGSLKWEVTVKEVT